jgi:hypothetical protein
MSYFPGWGRGWRRVVTDWYLRKEPIELSECVTKYRGQYGWTHRDIIKLSHPKSADVGNDGLCYEIFVLCSLLLILLHFIRLKTFMANK